jgi:hypothetical protein
VDQSAHDVTSLRAKPYLEERFGMGGLDPVSGTCPAAVQKAAGKPKNLRRMR